ncbi:MAG: DUF1080 domain-containing protein [Verrucomicrobiales bacterium]
MKRRLFIGGAAAGWLARPTWAEPVAEKEGWVPLFTDDGAPKGFVIRDWADVSKPAPEGAAWEVKDGVLRSTGSRGCWLISERDYGDFVLSYEFKLGPKGNSGCALRAPAEGDPAFDGLELQMADLRYNPEAKDSELTGGFYRAAAPTRQVYQPEEWNSMSVELKGSRAKVVLNGETIQDIDLSDFSQPVLRHNGKEAPPLRDRPRRGRIGFQELSRDDGHVQIRKARLRELPNEAKS